MAAPVCFRMISMISPEDSWVAKWQRIGQFVSIWCKSRQRILLCTHTHTHMHAHQHRYIQAHTWCLLDIHFWAFFFCLIGCIHYFVCLWYLLLTDDILWRWGGGGGGDPVLRISIMGCKTHFDSTIVLTRKVWLLIKNLSSSFFSCFHDWVTGCSTLPLAGI